MKKGLKLSAMTVFFAMLLGIAVMSIGTEQTYAMEGSGSAGNPYQISNYADLKEFADIVNGTNGATKNRSACAILTADIDASSSDDWMPIGTEGFGFEGTFDGRGHTIKKLSTPDDYSEPTLGLFGRVDSKGVVNNVGLVDNSFRSLYAEGNPFQGYGGVVGYNMEGTVENCYSTGLVSGNMEVGGVVGSNWGTVINCYNTGDVSGSGEDVGGVVGSNNGEYATTENCYNIGDVSGAYSVGGVVGMNHQGGTVENCYNTGSVSGNISFGGVAGYAYTGTITNCYYDKELCTATDAIGGISGGTIDNVKGLTTKEMTGTTCTAYDSWENFYAVWKLTDKYPVLEPHDHVLTYAKKESCVEPAHEEGYTCSICGKHYSDEEGKNLIPDADWIIPVTGHKYGAWTKLNATQHQKVCEHDKSHVVKENHKWDAGKVTKKATEKQAGVRTYTCTVCKATKTETIPKLKPSAPKTSGTPLAKATVKKNSLTIGWNKIQGAEGYDVFFALCNHGKKEIKCKKVKTIKGNKTFKWTKSGLKKGTAYKFYVRAYVTKNGKKTYVSKTPMFHAYTGNGTKNYTSAKSVTVNKTKVTLKKGKTFKIKAKVNKVNKKKKLMPKSHAPALRYMTTNKKVATVNSSGKITAKGKGTCVIYVYAHNGVSKQIKVTVK